MNEKNFVGLATDGDYVTCGSENNGLYVYYKVDSHHSQDEFDLKSLPAGTFKAPVPVQVWRSPVVPGPGSQGFFSFSNFDFDFVCKEEDVNEFVSAVCWKANSNVMVAANSQGTIKVLELV